MFKPGDLVFARVEGWSIWPGRIMCHVTQNRYKVFFYGSYQESLVKSDAMWTWEGGIPYSDLPVGNPDFNQAVDEMIENPNIFIVDYNDKCDHKCITCDQRRNMDLGEMNQPLNDSNFITVKDTNAVLKKEKNLSSIKPVKRNKKNTEKQTPRKKIELLNRTSEKRKDRMVSQLYFLPQSSLRKTPFRESQRMLKELVCPVCKKVHRTPIGLGIHMQEFHEDLSAQEIKARVVANRKKTKTKKKPVEVYQSDSSLVNIDELLQSDNEEFCQDDIDDLLKSSGDELCPINMERTNDVGSDDDGHNEILISQDEIEIVDVNKEVNQSSGSNVGPLIDFNDTSDSDIEIIEVVDKYEDFNEKRIQTYKKFKMTAKVYLQKLSVDDPQEMADVSIHKNKSKVRLLQKKEADDEF